MSDEKRRTVAQSGSAAESYFDSEIHRSGAGRETLVSWCCGATRALDAATEVGHTADAIADVGVSSVAAVGAAPEVVTTAVRKHPVAGATAGAERLPLTDDVFDTAACRIAAYHFPNPEALVAEVARVLEPGGVSAFEDNVAPEDAVLVAFLNGVEALRDPTHVELHPVSRWHEWFVAAGLSVETVEIVTICPQFDSWIERTNISPADRDGLERRLRGVPEEAKELFDAEFDGDSVASFVNPKALVRARTE